MVEVKGIEKFAPKDFPGFIAATVFLGGCNFRCPYCHNSDLVLRPQELSGIPLDYLVCFLDSRQGWLEGVCISGGEPLLEKDLEELLSVFKERKLLVKIDTNGSLPERLEELLGSGLVDQIALDVKAPLEKYREAAGTEVPPQNIARSISLVRRSGLPHVFRTTMVPGLLASEDIQKIGQLLVGAPLFQIQQFSPTNTLDRRYLEVKPYSREEMQIFADLARPYFTEVRLEGV